MISSLFISIILPLTVGADTAEWNGNIDEVVVVSTSGQGQKRSIKGATASIDEHLSELSQVNLIRRGSYAWEPVVNNMQTERVSTTIDGMKIFYACTDKMDPVTSYVESGNLQSISLNSGLDGNPQATGNIGGSLDLKLRKVGFDKDPLRLSASAGHEFNGHLQVYGADAAVSSHRFYSNVGVFYRHAGNYKTGGGEVLPFSQFQKVNFFTNVGFKLAEHDIVEGTLIFDRATNVGYPALNMDVSKAQGVITSLSYKHLFEHTVWNTWETKVYYNHITHIMDDTKRPDVEIHMDMPGKSSTAGLYSLLTGNYKRHALQLNADMYYNQLFADMTMYPGGAAPMYMVTWPDARTLNTGLSATDNLQLTATQALRLSAKVAWQQQRLHNKEGYHALKVFFPTMTDAYHQTTARLAASYLLDVKPFTVSFGTGWGSRAATVTEAYGYYLNNTFDQYDYIGNPSLKNESAWELNASLQARTSKWNMKLEGNAFFFSNYIIGQFETRLSPMTIGAEGVKVYGNLPHASILNVSLTSQWNVASWLDWNGRVSYSVGRDDDGSSLPLISPVAYQSNLTFRYQFFDALVGVKGNARQASYGEKYGETKAAAWTIFNVSLGVNHTISGVGLNLRLGIENLFDRHYATYSDWNHIPQKGRNIYANVSIQL